MKSLSTSTLILFFVIITISCSLPQEIIWSRLSIGASLLYNITDGDLNESWGNFPSAGLLIKYKSDENFSFEGTVSFSYLKPYYNNLPSIFLINFPAGLKIQLFQKDIFNLSLTPGVSNSTFIFLNDAAEKVDDNYIESEFGVFISPSVEFILSEKFSLEFTGSLQTIFSSPVELNIISIGINILWL